MAAGADEDDLLAVTAAAQAIDQQEVTADMALPMVRPFAHQRMIEPLRLFARLGKVSQDEAETWLRARQATVDAQREHELREGPAQLFAAAAQKYLIECKRREVRTLDLIAGHVNILLPYIGSLPLRDVCNDALGGFKDERTASGIKPATINRSLEVVRTVLNRAARV